MTAVPSIRAMRRANTPKPPAPAPPPPPAPRLKRAFAWDPGSARYRDPRGLWVPRKTVVGAVNRVVQRAENRVRTGVNAYRKGRLSPDEFIQLLRGETKTTHILSYAAGKGGIKQLTQSDYGRLGATLKKQYVYLDRFAADLAAGEVKMDGRFLVRAALYVRMARSSYYQADRLVHGDAGMTLEHNILAHADHCAGCVAETARGWVPLGDLVPVGERDCLGNCLCEIGYR